MKWEYREAYIYGLKDAIEQLNEIGQEGWEFCFKYDGITVILKRAISEQKDIISPDAFDDLVMRKHF